MILSRVCVCMTTIRDKLSSIILGQVNFSCPQLPPLSKSAKNVHELRPQDIKVVMAIGDSITAGKKRVANDDSCSYNCGQLSCPIFRFWNVWPSWWFERIQGRYMPDLIVFCFFLKHNS